MGDVSVVVESVAPSDKVKAACEAWSDALPQREGEAALVVLAVSGESKGSAHSVDIRSACPSVERLEGVFRTPRLGAWAALIGHALASAATSIADASSASTDPRVVLAQRQDALEAVVMNALDFAAKTLKSTPVKGA